MKTIGDDYAFSGVEHTFDHGIPAVNTIPGLTKREYFAAQAMMGIFSNAGITNINDNTVASAIQAADVLIAQLNFVPPIIQK